MRHFLIAKEVCNEGKVTLDEEDARHIAKALRMRVGEEIVFSCEGKRFRGRLISVTPSEVTAEAIEELPAPPAMTPLTLVQAIPKGKKMDDIIRMATEIGVDRIVPLKLSRCETTATPAKIDRWLAIIRAADKQSRSLRFTEMTEPQSLDRAWNLAGLKLLLWEGEAPSLKQVLADHPAPSGVTIVIGPEGGFSDDEYRHLIGMGFLAVSLGPKILRTETAGVAALAALRSHLD